MFPDMLLTTERGVIAATIRFMRAAMWVAGLALRAARPSAAHGSGDINVKGKVGLIEAKLRNRRCVSRSWQEDGDMDPELLELDVERLH